jgi:hypothetical protein
VGATGSGAGVCSGCRCQWSCQWLLLLAAWGPGLNLKSLGLDVFKLAGVAAPLDVGAFALFNLNAVLTQQAHGGGTRDSLSKNSRPCRGELLPVLLCWSRSDLSVRFCSPLLGAGEMPYLLRSQAPSSARRRRKLASSSAERCCQARGCATRAAGAGGGVTLVTAAGPLSHAARGAMT